MILHEYKNSLLLLIFFPVSRRWNSKMKISDFRFDALEILLLLRGSLELKADASGRVHPKNLFPLTHILCYLELFWFSRTGQLMPSG
jgi:hypothetical protein